jgi:hypothetical protein
VDGNSYEIPEYWLVGRVQAYMRDGADPEIAYHEAVLDWVQQAILSAAAARQVQRDAC